MPVPEQIAALQTAAQDIIDGHDFSAIQNTIERAAGPELDDWYGGRIRKIPVAAAFGHIIGSRTIETNLSEESTDLSPYEKFLLRTQGVDRQVGEKVIEDIPSSSQTLRDAFDYFKQEFDRVVAFEINHPEQIRRRGKEPSLEPVDATDILVRQVTSNAGSTIPSTLVREVLRIFLREGRLPESEELTAQLKAELRLLGTPVMMSGQAFRLLSFGRELTKEHHRRFQSKNPGDRLVLPEWINILEDTVQSGVVSPFARQRASTFRHSLEAEHQQITASQVVGHCAAQFLLRPLHPEPAKTFFETRNVPLENDTFRLVDYQLLRAIYVAEHTIFSNPSYRAALQVVGEEIRSQTE